MSERCIIEEKGIGRWLAVEECETVDAARDSAQEYLLNFNGLDLPITVRVKGLDTGRIFAAFKGDLVIEEVKL